MKPHEQHLQLAIERIYGADELDIQCERASVLMARCVDADMDIVSAEKRYPELAHHFAVCVDCSAEYAVMRDLSTVTVIGQARIPVPPRPDRSNLFTRVRKAITIPFSGFAPQAQVALSRGADLDVEPVVIEIDSADLTVELDVGINETDATTRDLFCNVMSDSVGIEGLTIALSADASRTIFDENAVDELGDTTFERLESGQAYSLQIEMGEQQVMITDILLP